MLKKTGIIIGLTIFLFASKAEAFNWVFELIPQDGNLTGAPGEELIWKYTIKNNETTYWLDMMDCYADSWQYGKVHNLFDYPTLAPQTEATGDLLSFIWNAEAPIGFINSGSFIVSGDWFDADPYDPQNPGSFLGTEELSQDYTATCIPEPSTIIFLGFGIITIAGLYWKRACQV